MKKTKVRWPSPVMRFRVRSPRCVRKGNEDLLKAVDNAIAEMQKDGTLKALSEKWFGADVTQ
ncbi:Cystine-binding periplasmic protein [Salmonella enterica subsp. enterica]|nr:Cystine-binding periplasmic protein [Salmonella enterica subsp. enterica]